MPEKILIIKLGAMGDVVRTTPLLRVLTGDVYWVTRKESVPFLPIQKSVLKQVIEVAQAKYFLTKKTFDLCLSLDEDYEAARIASLVRKKLLIGTFLNSTNCLDYTDSSSKWFDMGLISKYGKVCADELKKKNNETYQEIIFNMLGKHFCGEEYILGIDKKRTETSGKVVIGFEPRAGERWPTKRWDKYAELGEKLENDGYIVKFLMEKKTVQEYAREISSCNLIVSGDTLALHIALAFELKVVGIFTCTSPAEIYSYGRMIKVISPLLEKAFYRKEYIPEAVEAISTADVLNAVKKLLI